MNYKRTVGSGANRLTIALFCIYLVALSWILLFKLGVQFSYMEDRRVNLIPFREYTLYGKMDGLESIMNVIIFIPLGVYAGILFKRWSFGKSLLFFFLFSLLLEGLQYVFRIGAFDITDTITNTLGGIAGWLIYKTIERLLSSPEKAQKSINIIAAAGTILMIILLVLLKANRLGIRYQ